LEAERGGEFTVLESLGDLGFRGVRSGETFWYCGGR
jgi:hypothetical protein